MCTLVIVVKVYISVDGLVNSLIETNNVYMATTDNKCFEKKHKMFIYMYAYHKY